MKARHENGELLVDFSTYGWNPDKAIEMDKEQYERFKEVCDEHYDGFQDMELGCLVDVIITMAIDGDIRLIQ